MRVTMNIDCTPEEARTFFGAPDVAPIQQAVMQKMQDQFLGTMQVMDPAEAMRQWQEMSLKNFQQFQKIFWSEAGAAPQEESASPPQSKAG